MGELYIDIDGIHTNQTEKLPLTTESDHLNLSYCAMISLLFENPERTKKELADIKVSENYSGVLEGIKSNPVTIEEMRQIIGTLNPTERIEVSTRFNMTAMYLVESGEVTDIKVGLINILFV